MNNNTFYVTLPSNASTDEFTANNPNHYKVRLPQCLDINGNNWWVELSSISLPDVPIDLSKLMPRVGYARKLPRVGYARKLLTMSGLREPLHPTM